MTDERKVSADGHGAAIYRITIGGHLGRQWTDWFDGLTVVPQADGNTLLTGPVVDQAALFSLLRKVRDLGKPLLSVCRIESELIRSR